MPYRLKKRLRENNAERERSGDQEIEKGAGLPDQNKNLVKVAD